MQIKNLTIEICDYFNFLTDEVVKAKRGSSPEFTAEDIVSRLIANTNSNLEIVFPEICRTTITQLLPKLFPGKSKNRSNWGVYLLNCIGLKHCSQCNLVKALAEFPNLTQALYGLRQYCKICHNKNNKLWAKENPEYITYKSKQHYSLNKDKYSIRAKQYYINNKVSIQLQHKKYYQNNRKSILLQSKKYYNDNRFWYSDYRKTYYKNNKVLYASYDAKRRATKLNATPSWANIEEIRIIYKYRPEGCHVDHIVPLQGQLVCGLHVEHNLQYLCSKDNLSKGNSFDVNTHIHTLTYTKPYEKN